MKRVSGTLAEIMNCVPSKKVPQNSFIEAIFFDNNIPQAYSLAKETNIRRKYYYGNNSN